MRYRDYLIKEGMDIRYYAPLRIGVGAALAGYINSYLQGKSVKDNLKKALKWGAIGTAIGIPVGQMLYVPPTELPKKSTAEMVRERNQAPGSKTNKIRSMVEDKKRRDEIYAEYDRRVDAIPDGERGTWLWLHQKPKGEVKRMFENDSKNIYSQKLRDAYNYYIEHKQDLRVFR